jgi:4-hydroxy-tetrahydrodipicolinate synthase
MKISGTFTALVTPFSSKMASVESKPVDWTAFATLLDVQIAAKVTGIVPCGTTGESPSLDAEEQRELVSKTVERCKGKARVIAGTGSASTAHAIHLSQAAEKAGADGVMVVVPYYNKPTQAGLREHFVQIAKSVKCPVVVYNIPGRTGVDLLPDTLGTILEAAPNVVAVKEATGNVLRAQELVRRFGDRLAVLSGDDSLTLPMIAVGACGVISVASNVLPAQVVRATKLALEGKMDEARRAHLALLPVFEAMFVEANPGPAKAALAHLGLIEDVLRSPMVPVADSSRQKILAALDAYKAQG